MGESELGRFVYVVQTTGPWESSNVFLIGVFTSKKKAIECANTCQTCTLFVKKQNLLMTFPQLKRGDIQGHYF